MRSFLRFLAAMLGFPLVLYGAASLTGDWLSTPPWWERTDSGRMTFASSEHGGKAKVTGSIAVVVQSPREGREVISGGVVAAGLLLAAFAAWPRREKKETS